MKTAPEYKILLKIYGTGFYRKYAGFFLVLLFIAFGFMRGEEHYMLMLAAMGSLPLFSLYLLSWFFYWLLIVFYSRQVFRQKQNLFLFSFQLYPLREQLLCFTLITGLQLLPVLLYSGTMAVAGIIHKQWSLVFLCSLFPAALWAMSIFLYLFNLKNPPQEAWLSDRFKELFPRVKKTVSSLPLFYLFHSHKLSLLLSKAASILLLSLVAYLYRYDTYDHRFAFFAVGLAGGCNAVSVFYIHIFQEQQLSWLRNLPHSLRQRYLRILLLYGLLLIPELIIIFRHSHPFAEPLILLLMFLFLLSVPALLHSYLLIRPLKKEIFIWHCSVIMLLYYFIIIFSTPAAVLTGMNFLISMLLFYYFYYRYDASAR